jgi:AraC-like DNA-binding protein
MEVGIKTGNRPTDNPVQFMLQELPLDIILDNGFFLRNQTNDGKKHTHYGFDVHFAAKGSFRMIVDNRIHTVCEHQAIVIRPNIFHGLYEAEEDGRIVSFLFAVNEKEYVKSDLAVKNLINTCLSYREVFSIFDAPTFLNLFREVIEEYHNHDCLSLIKMRSLMSSAVIDIMRHMTCPVERADYNGDSPKECDRKYIIDTYFQEKGNDPNASREELAKRLYITPRHLDRVIRNIYSCTFSQKLIMDRIKCAKYLLKHTNISISDISQSVGFVSHEYFYRCFNRYVGLTPGKYRLVKKGLLDIKTLDKTIK